MAFMQTLAETEIYQFISQATAPYISTRYLDENPPVSVPAGLSIPTQVSTSPEREEEKAMEFLADIPMRTFAIVGIVVGLLNLFKKK